MSFSPDFSSVSANNWAVPTAASPTPADFPAQANAVPGDSTPALDTYLPSAPLLQQPEQDVYGNPLPPQTEGLSDTYTPSFAQPDATTAQTAPPITGHPLQTALATGVGALAGGTIGGVVKNFAFNEDEAPKKEGTPTFGKKGWAIVEAEGFHSDGKPKQIKDTTNDIIHQIEPNGTVKSLKNNVEIPANAPALNGEWKLESDVTITQDVKDGLRTYKKNTDNSIELTIAEWVPKHTKENLIVVQRFLIKPADNIAVELDDKGNILKLITNLDGKTVSCADKWAHFQGLDTTEAEAALSKINISSEKKAQFLTQRKPFFGWFNQKGGMREGSYCRDPKYLSKYTQEAFGELQTFVFDTKKAELTNKTTSGRYTSWDSLKKACEFKPATKAVEEFDFGKVAGKFALPVGLGVVVGAGALFGLDYWLQHRTPKKSTEAELA